MKSCFARFFVVTVLFASVVPVAIAGCATAIIAYSKPLQTAEANRDKTGTNPFPQNESGSQSLKNKPDASFRSFQAEGMGLEPTTPLLGHHISSVAAGQFAYPPESQLSLYRICICVGFNLSCLDRVLHLLFL